MSHDRSPATVVIVARVPRDTTDASFTAMAGSARGVAVTWAADADVLERFAAATGDATVGAGWAVLLDAAATATRQETRRRLALAADSGLTVGGCVFATGVPAVHRDLLVAAGTGVAVVDRFDEAPRGTRRPAPEGWRCRSLVWGLWEIETATAPATGLGRLLPWSGSPAPGSLVVESIDLSGDARTAQDRLTRSVARHAGKSGSRVVTLGGLGALLGQGTATGAGSVLRAA